MFHRHRWGVYAIQTIRYLDTRRVATNFYVKCQVCNKVNLITKPGEWDAKQFKVGEVIK